MSLALLFSGGGAAATPPVVNQEDAETIPQVTTYDAEETFDVYPLECVLTHEEEAKLRLLKQFQESPRLKTVVGIFVRQLQELEDELWNLIVLRGIDLATDQYLDDIGALLAQDRNGQADDLYRLFIRAKLLANRSNSTPPTMYAIARTVLPDVSTVIELVEYPQASFIVYAFGPLGATYDYPAIFLLLEQARGAGIHFDFVHGLRTETEVFQFAPAAAVVTDASKGFSNVAVSTGGYFADVKGSI